MKIREYFVLWVLMWSATFEEKKMENDDLFVTMFLGYMVKAWVIEISITVRAAA